MTTSRSSSLKSLRITVTFSNANSGWKAALGIAVVLRRVAHFAIHPEGISAKWLHKPGFSGWSCTGTAQTGFGGADSSCFFFSAILLAALSAEALAEADALAKAEVATNAET